jgi:hypothetical protein
MVYRWERDLLKRNPTIEIIYRSAPGHRGVHGNEAADHWAKQGAMVQAASESSKGTTSLSHINRVVRERCQTVIQKRINDSLDNHKAYQLRRSLVMRKAIKDASVFFQLASGHANIGTYLERIGRKESDRYWYYNQAIQTRGYLFGGCKKWKIEY